MQRRSLGHFFLELRAQCLREELRQARPGDRAAWDLAYVIPTKVRAKRIQQPTRLPFNTLVLCLTVLQQPRVGIDSDNKDATGREYMKQTCCVSEHLPI